MHEPHYRDALSHGWTLARQHTYLWVFALFAAFAGHFGISSAVSTVYGGAISGGQVSVVRLSNISSFITAFPRSLDASVLAIWLLLTLLGLGVGLTLVALVSQGAIVSASARWFGRKKLPEAADAWHAGVSHMWRLLGLVLLKGIAISLIARIIAAVSAATAGAAFSNLLFLVVFLTLLVAGLIVSFLHVYAVGFVVVEGYSLKDSLISAWRLFVDHWLVSLEVAVLLAGVGLVFGLAALIGLPLFMLPAIILWFFAVNAGSAALYGFGVLVGSLLFIAFLMFIGAIYTVFSLSTWTYLFMKMHRHGIVSRIVHYLKRG